MDESSPTWTRLTEQIAWYDKAAGKAQMRYRLIKLAEIAVAASIPASAALGGSAGLAGLLGAVVVVLAGVQTLYGFQTNWTTYRSTCENLKREQHLYLARAALYESEDRDARLALAIEGHISSETNQWAATQQELAANIKGQTP
jgi:Protein of unknown function (DUF4231)